MKHVAVVGPIPRDTIHTHNGSVIKKYGGITNPVIALSHLLEGSGEVHAISNVRINDAKPIASIFNAYPNIRQEGISSEDDKGTVIQLRFIDQNKRIEKQTACMNPILPKHVEPYLDVDVFVFVPITDFEISLSTLKYLQEKSDALIIFDAHGPTNTMSVNGDRHQKFWIDRDEWLPYVDVLKMNLEEANCCWFKSEYNLEDLGNFDDNENEEFLDEFGEHVLKQGTKVLIVTLDSRGCLIYEMKDGLATKKFVPSVPVSHVVDTTGCGDSFAGGLAYGFIQGKGAVVSSYYANTMGALRTQGSTFDVFKTLDETKAIIEETYKVSLS